MSYSNYPSAERTPDQQPVKPAPKDNRKAIYAVLIVALLGTWGYIIYDKSKSNQEMNQLQAYSAKVDSSYSNVQREYEDALARMDSLTGDNTAIKGQLSERTAEIDKLKTEINGLLKDRKNLGAARAKIAELNAKISDLVAEVERLKEENGMLTNANQQLTTERDTLSAQKSMREQELMASQTENARVTDLASTLHISNINIAAIDVKGDNKEKVTDKAKKADLLRVSFQVDENRVAASGQKEFYVIVTGPDGKVVSIPAYGSGTFTTRDEGEKAFTSKVNVDYQQGVKAPASFDWKQDGKYAVGDYKIEIYQNGFKIAETTKTLKKNGFLGL
jgi:hypothetical protein